MRFLADESCDAAVVRALQGAGHDVGSIAHTMRGATDVAVLATALLGGRVLITEDKDFGEIVFAARKPAVGVLLLRYPSSARSEMASVVLEVVTARSAELTGAFTVIGPAGVRTTPLPTQPSE
jgi:predicted nuclease of predicted toxin-antitoxin system